jgi:hypothetical protein
MKLILWLKDDLFWVNIILNNILLWLKNLILENGLYVILILGINEKDLCLRYIQYYDYINSSSIHLKLINLIGNYKLQ